MTYIPLCIGDFAPDSAELGPACQRTLVEATDRWIWRGGRVQGCPERLAAHQASGVPAAQIAAPRRIELYAHADGAEATRGTADRISAARADAVLNFLALNCIPRDVMTIYRLGATRPLVPTAPSVAEPQNRRVEIVFR